MVFRKYLRRVALTLPPLQELHARLVQLRQANADLAAVIATTTDERDRLLQELAATTAGRERLLAAATADRGRLLYQIGHGSRGSV